MGKKMSISEMDELFHSILLKVQRRYPKVLPDSVKITDKFSTFRSLRHGTTLEAQIVEIPFFEKLLRQTIDGESSAEQRG
jgi:hypothetical protein